MKHSLASLPVPTFRHVSIAQCWFLILVLFLSELNGSGAGLQLLGGHVPGPVKAMIAEGDLAGTKQLNLAIGLPLRNTLGLSNLLEQIYNPASPNFRRYLTQAQFTERFGPTPADYEAVVAFATANHLQVTARHSNRMVLDVVGSAFDVERALHIKFHTYRHPAENRTFFAPDTEPTLDLNVPVLHISGLDDYVLPKPLYHAAPTQTDQPQVGSGPSGAYIGSDFRAAYAPGVNLTGSGQSIGLYQYASGYYQSDITEYEAQAHLPNVPVNTVLLDGYGGGPGRETVEVSLDIEMAMSMAPAVSNILVFEGYLTDDILNAMAASNQVKQLSASWSYSVDSTSVQIFQEFAAQGQSFFNASGDSDAWIGGVASPSDDPYITIVGGTSLTTGSGGAWSSETVWNRGNGSGSGGGISTQYPIPSWQTNINMTANQGSTTMRNIPDVAMVAEDVWVTCSNGSSLAVGGTSCAAPLWAGFAALANQEAASDGVSSIGFINPAIYALGAESNYGTFFHDITTGNNAWSGSANLYNAVPGYDLCTGWGTPAGQNLIDALADTEPLVISPAIGFNAVGGLGGPFTPASENLTLTNHGTSALSWTLVNTSSWLNVSSVGGVLAPGGPASTLVVGLNNSAKILPIGTYTAGISFTNLNDGIGQSRSFGLSIIAPPAITVQPTNQSVLDGATASFNVTAVGGMPLFYQWRFNGTNLTDGGAITGSATTSLTISNISTGQVGIYSVVVSNYAGGVVSSNALLSITNSAPVITQQPSNVVGTVGATVNFSVAVIGTKPLFYQWFFNQTNLLMSATNATLTLSNVQLANAGIYSIVVSNSLGSVLSSNASLTLNPCDPVPSGIVAWWPGEGNADDIVGGNNGVLMNGGGYATGEVGTAFNFIGTSQFLLVQAVNSDLDVGQAGGLTAEAWINPTSLNVALIFEYERILDSGSGNDVGIQFGVGSAPEAGDLVCNLKDTGNVDHIFHSTLGIIVPGIWQHVALTYDEESGTATFYRNGIQVGSANLGRFVAQTSFTNFLTARTYFNSVASPNAAFSGGMDELSLYGRALTSNEIASIYAVGSSGKCFTPIAPFIINQPTNETVTVDSAATFSVTAGGTGPLSYQWRSNSISLANATNATLVLNNVQLNQNGNIYSVLVTSPYGSTNSSNAVLTVNPPPPCDPVPSGIVGWWSAEGNTMDIAGSNNGTPVGPLAYTNGEVGQGFYITNANVYVDVPASSALNVGTGNGFTIEMWINPTDVSVQHPLAEWGTGDQGSGHLGPLLWISVGGPGNLLANILDTSTASHVFYSASGLVQTNVFQHVALTYDKTTGNAIMYYNGAIAASANLGVFIPETTAGDLLFGHRMVTGETFPGVLDEISLYNRALSSNEIAAIYNAGISGKCLSSLAPVITSQPTNQTVNAGVTVSLKVAAAGALPLNYQWYFDGTNIVVGATNATLMLTNVQLTNAGSYVVTVTNMHGMAISTNAILTVNDVLDHFTWNPIPSPRFVNVPFAANIQARGTTNGIFASFNGTILLTTTNGSSVNPSVLGGFVQGVWAGTVKISKVTTNLVLEASDGSGRIGFANTINVIAPPSLGTSWQGINTLLIYWPVDPAGFVLENSPSLMPAQWVPVSAPPLQLGSEYLQSIQMAGTNQFYRLRYTLP
jgi:hypothetical protein